MILASQNIDVDVPPASTVILRFESTSPSFAQVFVSMAASGPIHFGVFSADEYAKFPNGTASRTWPSQVSLRTVETLLGSARWVFVMSNTSTAPVHVAGSFSYGPASR